MRNAGKPVVVGDVLGGRDERVGGDAVAGPADREPEGVVVRPLRLRDLLELAGLPWVFAGGGIQMSV